MSYVGTVHIAQFNDRLRSCQLFNEYEKLQQLNYHHGDLRNSLVNVGIDMLNDKYGVMEDITIVAHSMGGVVTYDALGTGGKIASEIERLRESGKQKKITFVSVGSGINQVMQLAKGSNEYAKATFRRPLAREITGYDPGAKQDTDVLRERFFWLDIYARFDPVAAGELNAEIQAQAGVHADQVKRRMVVNLDNPIRDHTYYWHNKLLVMPRIVRAINGGTDYPWKEAGITNEKLAKHYKKVAMLVFLRIIMSAIVVGSIVAIGFKWLPLAALLTIALVSVGLYQAIRASKFGDIS